MTRLHDERGSASLWVLACAAAVLAFGSVATMRSVAVAARHRAETAVDLAALAAADQIGVDANSCAAARRIAEANAASLTSCVLTIAADGRSGTVTIEVTTSVDLPLVGRRTTSAHARAGRLETQPSEPENAQPYGMLTKSGIALKSVRFSRRSTLRGASAWSSRYPSTVRTQSRSSR